MQICNIIINLIVFSTGSSAYGFITQLGTRFRLLQYCNINRDEVPLDIQKSEFMGRGCILLAQPGEFSHFLIKGSVFITEHNDKGSVGVILERPTAFTMGETSPNIGLFEGNTLFMGGGDGGDTAIMLGRFDLGGTCKYIGSGIYLGGTYGFEATVKGLSYLIFFNVLGISEARNLIKAGTATPKDFKFFFNNVIWNPGELEKELQEGRWDVVTVPPKYVLSQDARAGLWNIARRKLKISSDAEYLD